MSQVHLISKKEDVRLKPPLEWQHRTTQVVWARSKGGLQDAGYANVGTGQGMLPPKHIVRRKSVFLFRGRAGFSWPSSIRALALLSFIFHYLKHNIQCLEQESQNKQHLMQYP